MRIRIDFEITDRARRAITWFALPFAILAGSAAVARAWTADTSWIMSGKQISASKLMNILNEADNRLQALESKNLDTRLAKVEATLNTATATGSYSLGATFCGYTAATSGGPVSGALKGYQAVRAQCQAVSTCSATSAHMCTAEELVRTRSIGKTISMPSSPSYGWYSSGTVSGTGATSIEDCAGWTVNSSGGAYGLGWYVDTSSSISYAGAQDCGTSHPILCCN